MTDIILNTGDLAYLSILGRQFVKLKVIRIENDIRQDGKPVKHVVAKVTGPQVWPHRRGDIVTSETLGNIVPRTAVKRKRGAELPYILPFTIGE